METIDHRIMWAMERSVLDHLVEQYQAGSLPKPLSAADNLEALKAQVEALGQMETLHGARLAAVRDGVAVIPMIGMIRPRPSGSFFEMLFGGMSTDLVTMENDLRIAMAHDSVRGVLIFADSPGGLVSGVSDFAGLLRLASDHKPISTFVAGDALSAAQWIAAAAGETVVSPTGQLGSIGVQITATDTRKLDDSIGIKRIHIVNSASPRKNLDLATEDGRQDMVARLDAVASVFIGDMAKFRGVSDEDVIKNFGAGGVLVGAEALDVGLADAVGTFEETLTELASGDKQPLNGVVSMFRRKQTPTGDVALDRETLQAQAPQLLAQLIDEGKAAAKAEIETQVTAAYERGKTEGLEAGATAQIERIKAIQAQAIPGAEAYVAESILNPEVSAADVSAGIVKMIQDKKLDIKALARGESPGPLTSGNQTEEDDPAKPDPSDQEVDAFNKGIQSALATK